MTTQVFRQSRALRDSVAEAHVRALNTGKFDKVFNRLMKTSRAQANLYASKFGGTYDPKRTQKYIQAMTRSQLSSVTDGLGSATSASHFGIEEFARQNPGRNWLLTWHHGSASARPRPEHIDMDGRTARIGEGFDVTPGLGAPGCGCMIELIEPTLAPQTPAKPRVVGANQSPAWNAQTKKELQDDLTAWHDRIAADMRAHPVDPGGPGLQSRWNGTIRVGDAGSTGQQAAAGVKEWSCSISITDDWVQYSKIDRAMVDAHEMAHSFSMGSTQSAYRQFGPIEEATVEGYARAITGVKNAWAYDDYMRVMEDVRKAAGIDELTWYRTLMQVPVKERLRWMSKVSGRSMASIRREILVAPQDFAARPAVKKVAEWADDKLDDALRNGDLKINQAIRGQNNINEALTGTIEYEGKTYKVIVKNSSRMELDEVRAELFTQTLNDAFGFVRNMPRIIERRMSINGGPENNYLIQFLAPGKTPVSIDYGAWSDYTKIVKSMEKSIPLEDRQAVALMDAVIGNKDRHVANFLLSVKDGLIPIDHGQAFSWEGMWWNSAIQQAAGQKLSAAGRKILQKMIREEDKVREAWRAVNKQLSMNVDWSPIDQMYERIRYILEHGEWPTWP